MKTEQQSDSGLNAIQVAHDFRKAHPLTRKALDILSGHAPDKYGRSIPWGNETCVNVKVSKPNVRRALLVLDALARALLQKGHDLEVSKDSWAGTHFNIGTEKVRVHIIEKSNRHLLPKDKSGKAPSYFRDDYEYRPTGYLTFTIDEYFTVGRKIWNENADNRLESHLDEIFYSILEAAKALQVLRLKREEEDRLRAQEQRRRQELERLRLEEEARCKQLENHAEAWHKSRQLCAFVHACEQSFLAMGPLIEASPAAKWLHWAREHARSIDPFMSAEWKRTESLQRQFITQADTPDSKGECLHSRSA